MIWNEQTTAIFVISAAIWTVIGNSMSVLLPWIASAWASRSQTRLAAKLNQSLESYKSDLMVSLEKEKAKLQEFSNSNLDRENRKRDIYARLASSMRVFLKSSDDITTRSKRKQEFLAALDESYLWASEPVLESVCNLLAANICQTQCNQSRDSSSSTTAPNGQHLSGEELYKKCLLAMRRDCGFPPSDTEIKLVTFGMDDSL